LRLLSFKREDEASYGAIVEGRIVDFRKHLPEFDSLRALLEGDALVRALDTAAEVSPDHRLDKVTRLPPVTDPAHVLCVFDEARDEPVTINPKFLRGADQPLLIPGGDAKPLAAGIALVLGPGADSGERQVAGMALVSYLSPAALAVGPWLVTTDELGSADAFTLSVDVDGQSADVHLADLREVVRRLGRSTELATGDVIAVLKYLSDVSAGTGDVITVTCDLIGTLKNPVVAEESSTVVG
jgi:hypothetical protein